MSLESRAFSIPIEAVSEIQKIIASRGVSGFTEYAYKTMVDKHPALATTTGSPPKDWNSYKIGRAVGYIAVLTSMQFFSKMVELASDDLNIHIKSVQDYIGKDESDEDWPENQFNQRLEDSKDFINYLNGWRGTFQSALSRKIFSRGVYDSMMPILSVIDRNTLEAAIW